MVELPWDGNADMKILTIALKPTRATVSLAVVAVSFMFLGATAQAQSRVYGCSFASRYDANQAAWATKKARPIVGSEADSLHKKYIELKSACHSNPKAQIVVQLSPKAATLAKLADR